MISVTRGVPTYHAWLWKYSGPDHMTNFRISNRSYFRILDENKNIIFNMGFEANSANRLTWDGKDATTYCVAALEDTADLPLGIFTYEILVVSTLEDKLSIEDTGEIEIKDA